MGNTTEVISNPTQLTLARAEESLLFLPFFGSRFFETGGNRRRKTGHAWVERHPCRCKVGPSPESGNPRNRALFLSFLSKLLHCKLKGLVARVLPPARQATKLVDASFGICCRKHSSGRHCASWFSNSFSSTEIFKGLLLQTVRLFF